MDPLAQLTEDMKSALRAGDKGKLETVRYLIAAVKNAQIDKPDHSAITEPEFHKLVAKIIKMSEEAITQFRSGGRDDLADAEEVKVAVWKAYLPTQLTEDELRTIISQVKTANPGLDIGPLTGKVMAQTAGRADGGTVRRLLQEAV